MYSGSCLVVAAMAMHAPGSPALDPLTGARRMRREMSRCPMWRGRLRHTLGA
jgi:hypothetical protein